ncbi:MAG: Translation initiation factor IF-2 [candidate division TM6 bacterium GW2011_GWE2_36_25]|nr:MAG: Translation initiation factor IF-2 [candidate division TM6 bacterium GW2011_GWF2_36_131]KKQ03761.1 MAG: Translation initiation factor IF-2 [candidate division TM6 bacterium GW2011_GWE2_36_25]KKQ19906.1 MAG: Translation initiation factor IF-2 [candidate division TM6 bacterium GW2011_GWA2_36_9]
MSVGEFADIAGCPSSEIILFLLRQGMACNKNQVLPVKTIEELAAQYGLEAHVPEAAVEAVESGVEGPTKSERRAPIVVVVGHVDHGKTTLLDYIRKTRVAQREKGGITQHLGAYTVATPQGEIVFLDTPGHEAFTTMRMRGVKVADMAILIIAVDDGVMPQTIEAIKHAKGAKVPIIVALNKIDKAGVARLDDIKTQLSKQGLLVEDWGGDVICVPVSAKEGTGVDHLLEMVNLQAELLELKTSSKGPGVGYILESKVERGRGPVGTVILQYGSVKVGDFFMAGNVVGRVNSLTDSDGKPVKVLGPTNPAQIAGFDEVPQAGDVFRIVLQEEYKKARSGQVKKIEMPAHCDVVSDESLNVILKVDTYSSQDALISAVQKLATQECKNISVVYAGVGAITESDVMLASTAGARIYGFGIKPEYHVQALAKRLGVFIGSYYVIYHLLDDLKEFIELTREPEKIIKKTGEAIVLKVFHIKGSIIAGCSVKSGKIIRGSNAIVWRGPSKIGEGKVQTLQRERRSMKEVAAGFECGLVIAGIADYQPDDRIECFVEEVVAVK